MHTVLGKFCLVIFVSLNLLALLQGSGFVEVRLKSYSNQNGTDDNGFCCEKDWTTVNCDPCDPYIEMYLVHQASPSVNASERFTSQVYQNTNNVTFGLADGSVNITFANFSTDYILVLNVWDDDSKDASPSSADKLEVLTFNVGQGEPSPYYTNPPLVTKPLNGRAAVVLFEYRIMCDQNYYSDCGKYCKPNPGQYNCSRSGARVCETGWMGKECDIRNSTNGCLNHQCQHNATCTAAPTTGYSCYCTKDFTGALCDTRVYQPTTSTVRPTSMISTTPVTKVTFTSTSFKVTHTGSTAVSQAQGQQPKGSSNTGVIVGCSIGAVAVIGIAVLSIYFIRKYLQKKNGNVLPASSKD